MALHLGCPYSRRWVSVGLKISLAKSLPKAYNTLNRYSTSYKSFIIHETYSYIEYPLTQPNRL